MYRHTSNGVELVADNNKFKNAVFYISENTSEESLIKGVAGIIGWHAVNIWPNFGKTGEGFGGYDCPNYKVVRESYEDYVARIGGGKS